MAELMPLPLTVSCFSKIQIGFTFMIQAHPGGPRKMAVKRVCVCCICALYRCLICLFVFLRFIGEYFERLNARDAGGGGSQAVHDSSMLSGRHMSVDSVNSYSSSVATTTTDVSDADKKKKRKNWVRCSPGSKLRRFSFD